MWRFVLRENIRRYRNLLAKEESSTKRATLRRLLREAEEELEELEEASTPALAQRDYALKFFAENAVEQAVRVHAAQFSTLQIYDEARERLIILAQRNFRPAFLHHLASVKPGDGSACGSCLQNSAPAVIEDVNRDPAFEPHR